MVKLIMLEVNVKVETKLMEMITAVRMMMVTVKRLVKRRLNVYKQAVLTQVAIDTATIHLELTV